MEEVVPDEMVVLLKGLVAHDGGGHDEAERHAELESERAGNSNEATREERLLASVYAYWSQEGGQKSNNLLAGK